MELLKELALEPDSQNDISDLNREHMHLTKRPERADETTYMGQFDALFHVAHASE